MKRISKEELAQDKRLMQSIINLEHNAGYQEILKQLAEEVQLNLDELAEISDPDEVILAHAKWRIKHSTLSFLSDYPTLFRQQYIEEFGINPEDDVLVN